MYIRGGFSPEPSSEKFDMAVLLVIIFAIILVGCYTATYDITTIDKAVCIEKRVCKDSITFRFKRDYDSEEFQYTINAVECGKKVFNELNDRIKKDTICVLETNKLDDIKHVGVMIEGK